MWWISLVAFHTRNRPPTIRIRSRQEKPWPKASNSGVVRRTMIAMVPSNASRKIRAKPMPIRRPLERWCSGSRLVTMETKIRLSIPSTTSIAIRVTRAIHTVGSATSSAREVIVRRCPSVRGRTVGRAKGTADKEKPPEGLGAFRGTFMSGVASDAAAFRTLGK